MKKFKKLVSMALASTMVVGMLAGCGNNAASTEAPKPSADASTEIATPEAPVSEDQEWITLRVEMYDRSIAGFNVEDCMQLHYIQENFGDPNHIKVEWVPV